MAVYKPTLCFPFLNGVDARIGAHSAAQGESEQLVDFLSCKIDTSNKNITGYKIKILDNNNNQIFPIDLTEKISPITDLQHQEFGYEINGVNSGINGTTLKIPFFQNISNITGGNEGSVYLNRNAIYYSDEYLADHIIIANDITAIPRSLTSMEQAENWTYHSDDGSLTYDWPQDTPEETKIRNAIELDGDRIMDNDIILVAGATATLRNGLWKVSYVETNTIRQTKLYRLRSISAANRITILHGATFHNTSWECTSASQSGGIFEWDKNGAYWSDSLSNKITGFDCKDSNFKWEITLYQGNYTTPNIQDGGGAYIEYNDVSSEWLDMTLTSGKIMGTTSERLQLAGIFNDSNDDETNYQNALLPSGTDTDPLVLQGKYAELVTNRPEGITSGNNRVYIKTYDSTFGHAYPIANSLNSTVASNANYCQFFEHSNDPKYILDTDIVNYAFGDNKTINFYGVNNNEWVSYGTNEAAWLANTSITARYMVISTTAIDGIQDGDLIILYNQTLPKQNGVYLYFSVSSGDTRYYCIKRATSYDSWSDYIGKIIYAQNGSGADSNRSINLESLAQGGYNTLWNPLNTTSGSSSLYFVKERPILLFQNKLKTKRTFNLFDHVNEAPTEGNVNGSMIDGVGINIGDWIIYADGGYGVVTQVNPSSSNPTYYLERNSTDIVDDGDYFYILNGQTYAKLVFKKESDMKQYTINDANWDLHTATLMKNTATRTFISPWTDLQNNMKVCLLNNKTVTESGGSQQTQWIRVKTHNSTLFYITHNTLTSALKSEDSSDKSIPWKYDIRYFFKSSNENPFCSYEKPYLKLYKNGELYSDISMVGGSERLYVWDETDPAIEAFYSAGTSVGIEREQFFVSRYVAQTAITGRSVQFSAAYIQFGQSSWESYEWLLYDNNDNVIQDTGKRYSGDMSVSFYGLANDTSALMAYKAVLLVENDYGDILEYVIDLSIAPGSASSFLRDGASFTAVTDCASQSVSVNFDGAEVGQSFSIYRREYEVYQKPGVKITGFYCPPNSYYSPLKYGKFYTDSSCATEISPKNESCLYIDKNTGYVYQYNPQYGQPGYPAYEFNLTQAYKIYRGEWQPVLVKDTKTSFRDFNVSNGRSYQYILYPGDDNVEHDTIEYVKQTFANYDGLIWVVDGQYATQGHTKDGNIETAAFNGEPILTNWNNWSIVELIPEELTLDIPIVKHKYRVDNNNIWLFKYSLESGSQAQKFNKEEIQTLGQFPKFGFGKTNLNTGSISALLGSEIVLYSKEKYVERLSKSRVEPLSTNEKVTMLKQWQDFCFSKNPKLLRDIKGQAWIVQIVNNNSTTQNFVKNNPDKISFDWIQIESVDNVIIYGNVNEETQNISDSYGDALWLPLYKNK